MADKVLALVRYYAREGYARQLQTVCSEVLKKRANDALLVFWRAYGVLLEGGTAEVSCTLVKIGASVDRLVDSQAEPIIGCRLCGSSMQ
jgi:tetratricopeptide repeat protein 21B